MTNPHDYSFSKHVKVPEEWVEKALAVPSAHPAKPHGFSLRSRRLAAAAGFVLALGLSILLYFYIRNINSVSPAVIPSAQPASASAPAVHPTSPTGSPAVIDAPTVLPPDAPQDTSVTGPATEVPSQPPTQLFPTAPPTTASQTEPLHTEPTISPTQPDIPPTQPTVPSEEPISEPSTVDIPTEGPNDDPSPSAENNVEIYAPFGLPIYQSSESDADELIFCRIYDEGGALIGESGWFGQSHAAQLVWIGRTPYLYYAQALPADAHAYRYVFYDSAGRTLKEGFC